MSLPAIIIITLAAANLAAAYRLRNEVLILNPALTLVSTLTYGVLLYWGGFFN